MSSGGKYADKPSKVTKDRLTQLVHQEITDSGKLARNLCQHSGSRDVSFLLSIR